MAKGQIIGNCRAEVPRTGMGSCDIKEGKTVALIITDLNAYYPIDSEEFIQNLDGYVSDPGVLRMYPIKKVISSPRTGGDLNIVDNGTYGGSVVINLNGLYVAFQIDSGDCMYKELAKFNTRNMRALRVDDQGRLWGTVITRGAVDYYAGFEISLYALKTGTDGSTAYNLSLYAFYTSQNESEEINNQAFEVGINNIPDGLLGVRLVAGTTTGTATVVRSCGGDDQTVRYGEDWTEDMFLTETGTTPTSVTFNASTGLLTIAPAGSYRVAPANVLSEGNIIGLDGEAIYATITGA